MAYDSVRKQLDQLLGVDRNELHARQKPRDVIRYHDPKVCKHYLLGLCPSTLSIKHRQCGEICNKIHSDETVDQFRKDDTAGLVREKVHWARDLASVCRAVVYDEDRRIQGIARRLKETYGFEEPPSAIMVRSIETLQALGLLIHGVSAAGAPNSDGELEEGEVTAVNAVTDDGASDHDGGKGAEKNTDEITVLNTSVQGASAGGKSGVDDEIKILNVAPTVAARSEEANVENSHRDDAEKVDSPRILSAASADADKVARRSSSPESAKYSASSGSAASGSALSSGDGRSNSKQGGFIKAQEESTEENEQSTKDDSDAGHQELPKSVSPRRHIAESSGIGPDGLLLNKEYKLRVCGQCGGLISLHDAESRLSTHYAGKAHTSAVAVRSKLAELDFMLRVESFSRKDRPVELSRGHYPDGGDKHSFERERHRGRRDDRNRSAFQAPSPIRRPGFSSSRRGNYNDGDYSHRQSTRDQTERGRRRSRSRSPSRSRSRSYSVSRSPSPGVRRRRGNRPRSPPRWQRYHGESMRYDDARHQKRMRSRSPMRHARRHRPRYY